jgi:hypothetical protein
LRLSATLNSEQFFGSFGYMEDAAGQQPLPNGALIDCMHMSKDLTTPLS